MSTTLANSKASLDSAIERLWATEIYETPADVLEEVKEVAMEWLQGFGVCGSCHRANRQCSCP